MVPRKIVFVVAHTGYQPIEYAVPKKLLEQSGFQVMTASDQSGTATAVDGTTTEVDLLISDIKSADYDGIFFIGGDGALEHLDNHASYTALQNAAAAGKAFGAICISTRILAKAGVLQGKQATGWNGDSALGDLYQEHEVSYVPKEVVVHGMIVTATGPSAAREFGERIIALLQ